MAEESQCVSKKGFPTKLKYCSCDQQLSGYYLVKKWGGKTLGLGLDQDRRICNFWWEVENENLRGASLCFHQEHGLAPLKAVMTVTLRFSSLHDLSCLLARERLPGRQLYVYLVNGKVVACIREGICLPILPIIAIP